MPTKAKSTSKGVKLDAQVRERAQRAADHTGRTLEQVVNDALESYLPAVPFRARKK